MIELIKRIKYMSVVALIFIVFSCCQLHKEYAKQRNLENIILR